MIKKILLIIFFTIITAHVAFAQNVFKITSVNFDTSNSLLFLTSADDNTDIIMKNIKLVKLQNPRRVYFDIDSAILTVPSQSWRLSSGGIKQVKIAQFSIRPNQIRVVFYLNNNFDEAKINFLRINNNIIIRLNDNSKTIQKNNLSVDYFQRTYREERRSSSNFYENLSISSEQIEKAPTLNSTTVPSLTSKNGEMSLTEIQKSFTPIVQDKTEPALISTPTTVVKDMKLKSKYYLNAIDMKYNGIANVFLLRGFGVVGIEKLMYLTNPNRVVFDIPNARINPKINNKEFKINNKENLRVAQFNKNTVRIVITSANLKKYFPIFSSDGQSLLIAKSDVIEHFTVADFAKVFTQTTDVVACYTENIDAFTNEFIIAFNAPVVHGIKRDNSKFTINFYNALRYNENTFENSIKSTNFSKMKMTLLPQVGLRLTVPLKKGDIVNSYLGADGKAIKIIVKRAHLDNENGFTNKSIFERFLTLPKRRKTVVIDPGHGGSDYGAIRAGINEKDINLDVAKRIQAILQRNGVNVVMTRYGDDTVSLKERTIITKRVSPDIFVSTHVNSSVKPDIFGIETHYYNQESLELAQIVHSSMVSHIKSKDRGIFRSRFYVINHTTVPAILVEIGFISNDKERAELVGDIRKQKTARAIANGILKYLNKK